MNLDTSTDPLPDDLISPTQAAKIGHISLRSVWRWIATGRLRAWRTGATRLLVSARDVRAQIRPVVPTVRIPPRDKNGERLLGDLDRKAEASAERRLYPRGREAAKRNGERNGNGQANGKGKAK